MGSVAPTPTLRKALRQLLPPAETRAALAARTERREYASLAATAVGLLHDLHEQVEAEAETAGVAVRP